MSDRVESSFSSRCARRAASPHHLFGDVKRLGGEHCAKDGYDEIEAAIFEIVQIGGIAFLKLAVGQALGNGALPAGRDEILLCRRPAPRRRACLRQSRRPVAASQIQHLEPLCDPERAHESLSAFSHRWRNAGKIALFPKCFVRIHCKPPVSSSGELAIASITSA